VVSFPQVFRLNCCLSLLNFITNNIYQKEENFDSPPVPASLLDPNIPQQLFSHFRILPIG
jgi:hypothetical protein